MSQKQENRSLNQVGDSINNIKMKRRLLILMTGISLNLMAENDTIRYQIVKDSPNNVPKTTLKLSPLSMNMSSFNLITVGYEVGIKTSLFKDKLSIGVDYFSCLPNGIYDNNYKGGLNDFNNVVTTVDALSNVKQTIKQSLTPSSSIDGHIGYTLKDNTKPVQLNVAINSSYVSSNIIQTSYITPTANYRRILKLNVGFKQYTSAVNIFGGLNLNDNQDNYIEANDGTKFYNNGLAYSNVDYTANGNTGYYSGSGGFSSGWVTQFKAQALFLGISKTKIYNYMIDTKYGKRGREDSKTTYFDVFYAPNMQVDPIKYFAANINPISTNSLGTIYGYQYIGTTEKTFVIDGNKAKSLKYTPFGFRLGFEGHLLTPLKILKWSESTTESNKIVSIGYKWEFGYLPGIKSKGLYTQFTLFVPINF